MKLIMENFRKFIKEETTLTIDTWVVPKEQPDLPPGLIVQIEEPLITVRWQNNAEAWSTASDLRAVDVPPHIHDKMILPKDLAPESNPRQLEEALRKPEFKVGDKVELEIKQAGDTELSRLAGEVYKVVRHEKGWVKGYMVSFFDRYGHRLKTFPRSKLTLAGEQKSLEIPQDYRDIFNKALDNTQMQEAIELDIEVGDVVLGGKYKNKRVVVKEIGTDELGQPTINGKPILKFRIEKFLPDEKKSKKTRDEEDATEEEE